jgi:hypothetical protein
MKVDCPASYPIGILLEYHIGRSARVFLSFPLFMRGMPR